MTSQEAASVIAMFHGAFPRTDIDDAVTEVWMNTLKMLDPVVAYDAAEQWINEKQFWPTVAEFNQVVRNIRKHDALPRPSSIHCDSTGWYDRGRGLEPCPSCNPWNKQLIDNGQWQDLTVRPPRDWIQPPACKPHHYESQVFSFREARHAIEAGYAEHHREKGTPEDQISLKIESLSAVLEPTPQST